MHLHHGIMTLTLGWALALAPACGDDAGVGPGNTNTDAQVLPDSGALPDGGGIAPVLIPGGGVSSGPVAGVLHVFVVVAGTDAPLSGALVRVGAPDAASPLSAATDQSGLVTFRDAALTGAQVVTVTAAGHVAATWFGVGGSNVTIPLVPSPPPPVPTATVSGTIEGWDAFPSPGVGMYRAALVGYAHTDSPLDPANSLQQPTDGNGTPLNLCIYSPFVATDPCAWTLTSRTGPVALYATIVNGDPNGTNTDTSDDTITVIGYAVLTGLDLSDGQTLTGQELVQVADLTDVTLSFPSAPAGLGDVIGVPYLLLGGEGRLPLYLFRPDAATALLPQLTGPFAGLAYDFTALANTTGAVDAETTLSFLRDVSIAATVQIPAWLPLPTTLSTGTAGNGPYSFSAPPGAEFGSVTFSSGAGEAAWHILLLDGSGSFSLPALSPDPLPTGSLTMTVTSLVVPSFDPAEFTSAGIGADVTQTSSAQLPFTR